MSAISLSLRVNVTPSGRTPTYPEVAPFYVSVQVSQHLKTAYHTQRFLLVKSPSSNIYTCEGLLRVEILGETRREAARPSVMDGVHLALTLYATSTSPDAGNDKRTFEQAIGDLSIPLYSLLESAHMGPNAFSLKTRVPFMDVCSERPLSKGELLEGSKFKLTTPSRLFFELNRLMGFTRDTKSGGANIRRPPKLMNVQEHQMAMRVWDTAYRHIVHDEYRPFKSFLKWMHFPRFTTRSARDVPGQHLITLRPTPFANLQEALATALFYDNLLQCGLAIVRLQAPFSKLPDVTPTTLILESRRFTETMATASKRSDGENLFWLAFIGNVLAVAASLYGQHTVYVSDHINEAGSAGRRSRAEGVSIVERVRGVQEVGGNDCEDKGDHSYMLLQHMRETSWMTLVGLQRQANADGAHFSLLLELSMFVRTFYAPGLVNTTASSASAAELSTPGGEDTRSVMHTFDMLLPRAMVEANFQDVTDTYHHFTRSLSASQRTFVHLIPPLVLEGTALMSPLLAPLLAYHTHGLTYDDASMGLRDLARQISARDLRNELLLKFPILRTGCFERFTGPTNFLLETTASKVKTQVADSLAYEMAFEMEQLNLAMQQTPVGWPAPAASSARAPPPASAKRRIDAAMGVRTEYLSGERALMSTFYRRVVHVFMERMEHVQDADEPNGTFALPKTMQPANEPPHDHLIVFSQRDLPQAPKAKLFYGVPINRLLLNDVDAFRAPTLNVSRSVILNSHDPPQTRSRMNALEHSWQSALKSIPAIAPLAAPATLPRRFRTAPLASNLGAFDTALPATWEALPQITPSSFEAQPNSDLFFIAIRSMELDPPPRDLVQLATELRAANYSLTLRRLRLSTDPTDLPRAADTPPQESASKEWVMCVISPPLTR